MTGFSSLLYFGAVAYLAVVGVFVAGLCRAAARRPWWEETTEEIGRLEEVDPGDEPRGRPSQDGQP